MENLDSEIVVYVLDYFSHLMTETEWLAQRHRTFLFKVHYDLESPMARRMKERGWITSDEKVLDLLKEGNIAFEQNVVKRILTENNDKVFFNNCPQCGKLARTPQAKQCRYCRFDWH